MMTTKKNWKQLTMEGHNEMLEDGSCSYECLDELISNLQQTVSQVEETFPDNCDDICARRSVSVMLSCLAESYPNVDYDAATQCLVDNVGDDCHACVCDIFYDAVDGCDVPDRKDKTASRIHKERDMVTMKKSWKLWEEMSMVGLGACQQGALQDCWDKVFYEIQTLESRVDDDFPEDCKNDVCTQRIVLFDICRIESYPDDDLDDAAQCVVDSIGDDCNACACDVVLGFWHISDVDGCDDHDRKLKKTARIHKILN